MLIIRTYQKSHGLKVRFEYYGYLGNFTWLESVWEIDKIGKGFFLEFRLLGTCNLCLHSMCFFSLHAL